MKAKLSDVVNRINGNVDRFTTELEYYVGGEHFDSSELTISRYGHLKPNVEILGFKFHFAFQERDVLFMARNPHLRKAGMVTCSGLCSDASYILRSKDEGVITQEFIAIQLQTDHFWEYCESHKVGSVNFAINYRTLAAYEFELPPIEIQKEISNKVWAAYRLKEAYKRLLAATDEMVKSQFIELIRDCETYLSISDLSLNFLKGITPTYVESSCVEVINQACVTWEGIDFSKVKYQNSESSFAKGILNSYDLLLTMTGRGTLGRCTIFCPENDDITYIADSHISILRVNNTLVLPIIIAKYISLSDTQDEIYRNYVTGSTNQLDIVFSKIKNFKIPVPPMALQKKFAEIVRQADKSKYYVQNKLNYICHILTKQIQLRRCS